MQSLSQESLRGRQRGLTRTGEATLEDFVRALAWSPSGRRLVAVTLKGTAHLIDAAGEWMGVPGMHDGGAFAVAWSPDGALFATGGGDGRLFLHESATTLLVAVASVGDGWVEHLAWSGDGSRLAATAGRTLRFFGRDGMSIGSPVCHEGTITSLAWLPAGHRVVTTSNDLAQVIELGRPRASRRMRGHAAIATARMSPDARWLAAGNHDGSVRVWGVGSDDELAMTGYARKVTALSWSPTEPLLASAGGAEITMWSLDSGSPGPRACTELAWHHRPVTSVALVSRGSRLLSVSEDGILHVARRARVGFRDSWESEHIDATGVPLSSLAVTANGMHAAAAGRGGRVFTWHLGSVG